MLFCFKPQCLRFMSGRSVKTGGLYGVSNHPNVLMAGDIDKVNLGEWLRRRFSLIVFLRMKPGFPQYISHID